MADTDDTRTPEEREADKRAADWRQAHQEVSSVKGQLRRAERLLTDAPTTRKEQAWAVQDLLARAQGLVNYADLIMQGAPE